MRIAIDLNDVVRGFSQNFLRYYIEGYNHDFDLTDFEFWSRDMKAVFPFASDQSYYNFIYNDFAYELYGKCPTCDKDVQPKLNEWHEVMLNDLDIDEPIEVLFVATREYGLSIGSTYFFLSKLGTKIREVHMPKDSTTVWDMCDVLITADPELLACKPEGKKSVKIRTEYNKEAEADYSYPALSVFLSDINNTVKMIADEQEQ